MAGISGFLVTVRTAKQGAAMEKGKLSPEYLAETSMLTVCPQDFERLALGEEKKARVKSSSGEIVVTCRTADGPEGIFSLPLGAPANRLIDGETHGTGVPNYKGFDVEIQAL